MNIGTFRHDGILQFVIICNSLTLMAPSTLAEILARETGRPVHVLNDRERSVAGAWNRGVELSRQAGCDVHLITAVDAAVSPGVIDRLVEFENRFPECDLWSATPNHAPYYQKTELAEACDFSCFMLRNQTIERHGWFDREFAPAYFEDDDYYIRLVLAGSQPKQILAARYMHYQSLTIKLDAQQAMLVQESSQNNKTRLIRKWGAKLHDYEEIRSRCYSSPFNSGRPLCWWPEQDVEGYSTAGGIDE
jgi:hypothetical protein